MKSKEQKAHNKPLIFHKCKVDKLTDYGKQATRQNVKSGQLFGSLINNDKEKDK